MLNMIKNFAADESGAVTVDWVVLTAAVVAFGFAVLTIVRPGAKTGSENIASVMETSITTGFE